jgi:hypothetical protein
MHFYKHDSGPARKSIEFNLSLILTENIAVPFHIAALFSVPTEAI